jgi:hypothetical protein
MAHIKNPAFCVFTYPFCRPVEVLFHFGWKKSVTRLIVYFPQEKKFVNRKRNIVHITRYSLDSVGFECEPNFYILYAVFSMSVNQKVNEQTFV